MKTLGIPVEPAYGTLLHKRIRQLLMTQLEGFPGSEPLPLCIDQLEMLNSKDYLVSTLGNGHRCLLFMVITPTGPATFMLTSENALLFIDSFIFPLGHNYHNETLLDGEFVVQESRHHFIAFDLMAINGTSMILMQDVITPFTKSQTCLSHISVEMKKHERAYGFHKLLEDKDTRGLCFTALKSPYIPGKDFKTCSLLYWKKSNTFRFKIRVIRDRERKAHYQIMVADRSITKLYDSITLEPETAQEWKNINVEGRIADFKYDPNWETFSWEQGYAGESRKGGWRFVRFRDDKPAGEERRLKSSFKSFENPVTIEMFDPERIRSLWKFRERRGSSSSLNVNVHQRSKSVDLDSANATPLSSGKKDFLESPISKGRRSSVSKEYNLDSLKSDSLIKSPTSEKSALSANANSTPISKIGTSQSLFNSPNSAERPFKRNLDEAIEKNSTFQDVKIRRTLDEDVEEIEIEEGFTSKPLDEESTSNYQEEELEQGQSKPKDEELTVEKIATKSPTRMEIPVNIDLPSKPIILPASEDAQTDEDSPLEDLGVARYSGESIIVPIETLVESKPATAFEPPSKKQSWLDMILN